MLCVAVLSCTAGVHLAAAHAEDTEGQLPSTGKGMVLWVGMLLPATALWVPDLLQRHLLHPSSAQHPPTCLRNAVRHSIAHPRPG